MAIYCTEYEKDNYNGSCRWSRLPAVVPSVVFKTRVRIGGDNAYRWEDVSTFDIFAGKTIVLFSLPGAFTPTCSTYQLPDFEQMAEQFYAEGIDDICCMSVNDSFVMNKWAQDQRIKNIKVIPDGNGTFTEHMTMLVDKENLGFGRRSWRYAIVVKNGQITDWFIEEGKADDVEQDPYLYTNPEFILQQIRGGN